MGVSVGCSLVCFEGGRLEYKLESDESSGAFIPSHNERHLMKAFFPSLVTEKEVFGFLPMKDFVTC